MSLTQYYTATTLDGFIADSEHSLDWLFTRKRDEDGPLDYGEFIAGVGAMAMGATTYEWILDHESRRWPYEMPCWVFTHRRLPVVQNAPVSFASGEVGRVYEEMVRAADGRNVWIVGGGDLAGQFADAGLLDEVLVTIAPVTLGAGAPLLPRRIELRLDEVGRNGDFAAVRYAVQTPLRALILVEGLSDQAAVETLAERRGRDLAAEGIAVVPIGGAQAIGRSLAEYGPQGRGLSLAGLCDAGEEDDFRRALERAGLGSCLTRADMEALGFYVCVEDLEDELIRAAGAEMVERVVAAQGDLGAFRTLQKQAPWRGRSREEQLRRFMGSGARRKIRYARLLVEALDPDRIPRPLEGALERMA